MSVADTSWVQTRICPNCRDRLFFDEAQQLALCYSCGSSFPIPVVTNEERRLRDSVDDVTIAVQETKAAVQAAAEDMRRTQAEYHDKSRALVEENNAKLTGILDDRLDRLQDTIENTEARNLLARAEMLLEEERFRQAYENCEAALNKTPRNARAYLLSLCAELRVKRPSDLPGQNVPLDTSPSYRRTLDFADEVTRAALEEWNAAIRARRGASSAAAVAGRPAWAQRLPMQPVAVGFQHMLALRDDGTVLASGANGAGQCSVASWSHVLAVAVGRSHSAGLTEDGTVLSAGDNSFGQCNTAAWRNVVCIAASENHTVGLRADGTLVMTGWVNDGWQQAQSWRDVVSFAMSDTYLVGLRADGTVAVADRASRGLPVARLWKNVVQVAAGASHVVALKHDGTVYAGGGNSYQQCDVRSWTDIVSIAAGDGCTLGLKRDGTALACGMNQQGQCMVGDWRDVVRVWSGKTKFVGLRRDGALVMTNRSYGEAQALPGWQNVVWAESNPYRTLAVFADGGVAAAGFGDCNVSGWTNVRRPFI